MSSCVAWPWQHCVSPQTAGVEQTSHVPIMACRALLEGWSSLMWQRFSGVLIWKTQNPWAGLRGQLYDWLLAPTGGYYGVMLACEAVHVQLNLHSCQVYQLVPLFASL